MTSAAIYARVSSARQKKDETIGSQTAALREHAAHARLDVPAEWVFEDEGHSGATLVKLSARMNADGALLIELEDNGCGFDASNANGKTGRGLTNIRSRASLIAAEVRWQPRAEGGTRFTLRQATLKAAAS